MEKLKYFLEKWQWASIEEADKTLTESEQKIWELMKKNQKLEKQLDEKNKIIKKLNIEAQKYYEDAYCNRQDIMQVADKAIRLLAKALELACANHPATCNDEANCNNEVDCVGCLVEYYKTQARKELRE